MSDSRTRSFAVLTALLLFATVARGQWVEDSVHVGGDFIGSLVYNSRENAIYGLSNSGDFVFAISCDSNRIVGRVDAYYPRQLAYDSTDNKAYCSFGLAEESLLVIDGRTHERIRAFALAGAAHTIWDATNDRLYVSCSYENDVAVIDCATDSVLCRIPAGTDPHRLTISEDQRKLYVNNWDGETVSIIDLETNEVVKTIRLDGIPETGCYSEVMDKYYRGSLNEVVVVDGVADTVVKRIALTDHPVSAVSVESHALVMIGGTHSGSDSVYVIDARADTLVGTHSGVSVPYAMVWSEATDQVYCASSRWDQIAVFAGDGSRLRGMLAVGDAPFSFALAPRHRRLYVGHLNCSMVYVIRDTTSGIQEGPERVKPVCPAATLTRGRLRVAEPGRLYDSGGRQVCLLRRGGNDVRHLVPGVYTVYAVTGALSRVVKVR